MENLVNYKEIENAIIGLRGLRVILDADVARFYGAQTKEINQAVRNNPDKFPDGYVLPLDKTETEDLQSKFLTANLSAKSRALRTPSNAKRIEERIKGIISSYGLNNHPGFQC